MSDRERHLSTDRVLMVLTVPEHWKRLSVFGDREEATGVAAPDLVSCDGDQAVGRVEHARPHRPAGLYR